MNPPLSYFHASNLEKRKFQKEILPETLLRIWWVLWITFAVSASIGAYNLVVQKSASFFTWSVLDIIGSVFFLVVVWQARRQKIPARLALKIPFLYFVFWVILMNGYFFSLLPVAGDTLTYAVGILLPVILFRIPPRNVVPVLLLNHFVFLAVLWKLQDLVFYNQVEFLACIGNGSMAVLLAGLASWFLFRNRWNVFLAYRDEQHQRRAYETSNSHLKAILENIPFQAWLKSADHRFLTVNSGFAMAEGVLLEEIPGKTNSEVYPPEQAAEFTLEDEKVMKTRQRMHLIRKLTVRGKEHSYEVFKSPVIDSEGNVIGTAGLARDITERILIEDKIRSADRAKSEFLATVSHEIRTPLNSILGFAHLLAENVKFPEEKEQVESILHSGRLLLSIINDILDFSKIEAGKLTLETVVFSPAKVLEKIRRMFLPQISGRPLELCIEISGTVPALLSGDQHRFEQIVVNLVSNAVKFTPKGTVKIELDTTGPRKETEGTVNIRLQVRDTGIGIASENLPLIFQPFAQADTSTSRKYTGTGLGLVIVSRLCQMMGGSISVQSKPGEGSLFTADLCLRAATTSEEIQQTDESNTPKPTEPDPRDQGTVLVVDDNPINRRMMELLFKKWKISLVLAESGAEALRLVGLHRFQLLLMDIQMPGMDGFEATKKLREAEKNENKPRVPVIGLTALAGAEDRQNCLEAGMDDVISKPVQPERLRARVLEVFRTASHPGQTPRESASFRPEENS